MRILAIDGGSSTTRAALIQDGSAAAMERVAVGVRDSARSTDRRAVVAQAAALATAAVLARMNLDPCDVDHWCGCGMLTSNLGLQDVPHVFAPAGMRELANRTVLADVAQWPYPRLRLIPGVRTGPSEAGLFGEMMRGEECEAFGLLEQTGAAPPIVCILPGSHNKLVRVGRQGRIEAIWTSLAGELTRSLAEHTVLAGSMPKEGLPQDPDVEWFARGADLGAKGVLHAAFSVRAAQVLAGATPQQCAALLVGAVVGADVREIIESGLLQRVDGVLVGGADPLRRLYTQELSKRGVEARAAPEHAAACASVIGAARIIQLAGEAENAL